jgi:hypothetical protein
LPAPVLFLECQLCGSTVGGRFGAWERRLLGRAGECRAVVFEAVSWDENGRHRREGRVVGLVVVARDVDAGDLAPAALDKDRATLAMLDSQRAACVIATRPARRSGCRPGAASSGNGLSR